MSERAFVSAQKLRTISKANTLKQFICHLLTTLRKPTSKESNHHLANQTTTWVLLWLWKKKSLLILVRWSNSSQISRTCWAPSKDEVQAQSNLWIYILRCTASFQVAPHTRLMFYFPFLFSLPNQLVTIFLFLKLNTIIWSIENDELKWIQRTLLKL